MTAVVNRLRLDRGRHPSCTYIGRPSVWGNPFRIGRDGDRDEVIAKYRVWITAPEQAWLLERARRELVGQTLVCWCAPLPCHGDVLRELVDVGSALDSRHPHDVSADEQERLGWGGWTAGKVVDAETLKRADDALLRLERS